MEHLLKAASEGIKESYLIKKIGLCVKAGMGNQGMELGE